MAGHHRDPAPRLTHVSCQGARTPQEHGHPRSTGCKQAAFVPLWARRVPWLHPHLICAVVPSQTCRLHEGLCPWDLRNQPKGAVLSHSPSPSQSHLDPPPSCHRSAAVPIAKWMSLRPPLLCYCLQRRGKGSGEPRDRSQFKHSWKESLPSLRGFNLRFPGMDQPSTTPLIFTEVRWAIFYQGLFSGRERAGWAIHPDAARCLRRREIATAPRGPGKQSISCRKLQPAGALAKPSRTLLVAGG